MTAICEDRVPLLSEGDLQSPQGASVGHSVLDHGLQERIFVMPALVHFHPQDERIPDALSTPAFSSGGGARLRGFRDLVRDRSHGVRDLQRWSRGHGPSGLEQRDQRVERVFGHGPGLISNGDMYLSV
jgi:hypothetical protein